ncbi:MAG: archease [Candidatus Brockarchaeota archaeon]|nr:archease [Candidatus Brockarchaeota archaeon]
MSGRSYRFLEHTSDAYVAASGRNLEEAFASAALAMSDIMTDPETVRPLESVAVEVVADDLESLLYRWLERLLVIFEVNGMIFSKYNVEIRGRCGRYELKANAEGERFDPAIHPSEVAIKAVTYHGMGITCGDGSCEVRVLFDI